MFSLADIAATAGAEPPRPPRAAPQTRIEQRSESFLQQRDRKSQELQSQLDSEASAELTFQPQTNDYDFGQRRDADVLANLARAEERRQARLDQLAAEARAREEAELHFRPEISDYSRSLQRDEPAHVRLYQLSLEDHTPPPSNVDEQTGQQLFHPVISKSPRRSSASRDGGGDGDEQQQQQQQPEDDAAEDFSVEESLYRDARERQLRLQQRLASAQQETEQKVAERKMSAKSVVLTRKRFERQLRAVFAALDGGRRGAIQLADLAAVARRVGWHRRRLRMPASPGLGSPSPRPAAVDDDASSVSSLASEATRDARLGRVWGVIDPAGDGFVDEPALLRTMVPLLLGPTTRRVSSDGQGLGDSPAKPKPTLAQRTPAQRAAAAFFQACIDTFVAADAGGGGSPGGAPAGPAGSARTARNTAAAAQQRQRQCTFQPTLNPVSRQLAAKADEARGVPRNAKRHEVLLSKAQAVQARVEEERRRKALEEVADCTFRPQINRGPRPTAADAAAAREAAAAVAEESAASASASPDDARQGGSVHEQLYNLRSRVPRSVVNEKTSEERELEEHCTFQPARPTADAPVQAAAASGGGGSGSPDKPAQAQAQAPRAPAPRGYGKTVERMRAAQQKREREQAAQERTQFTDESWRRSRALAAKGPQPFRRMEASRKKREPAMVMDVSLGPGKTGKIGIHSGDNPRALARNFARTYSLDRTMTSRLTDLITQHMRDADIPTAAELSLRGSG